jgi:hypothetical protein
MHLNIVIIMKILLLTACLLTLIALSSAQVSQTDSADLIDPTLNEIQNLFLNNQAEALLSQTNEVYSSYPPGWPEPPPRRSAFLLLDGVLHDEYAPLRPPVQDFFKSRIKEAIDEIEYPPIKWTAS